MMRLSNKKRPGSAGRRQKHFFNRDSWAKRSREIKYTKKVARIIEALYGRGERDDGR